LLSGRAEHGILPSGMPDTCENLSVRTYRDGKAGYILFEQLDSFTMSLTDMPCRIHMEYEYGFTRLGIGEAHTLRMLAQEFWGLTRNDWSLYPNPSHARMVDGTICHRTTNNPSSFHDSLSVDRIDEPPIKVQEDGGRGTSINSAADQASLLRYWAWARQSIAVGIRLPIDNHTVEYWFNFTLDPLPFALGPTTMKAERTQKFCANCVFPSFLDYPPDRGSDCTTPARRPYGPLSGAVVTPLGPDHVNVLLLFPPDSN
jgi:hypothetical protein